jgi:hypothetical protein
MFCACSETVLIAVAEDDQELLAAVAANRIVVANRGDEPLGDLFQNCVADKMSVVVVDSFEVVYVTKQE